MIKDYTDLFALKGQTIHIVMSPFGKENDLGNAFHLEWVVGDVWEIEGGEDSRYVLSDGADHYISLKDMGVVANNYNNHATFATKQEADDYAAYRKATFEIDQSIEDVEGEYDPYFTMSDVDMLIAVTAGTKTNLTATHVVH